MNEIILLIPTYNPDNKINKLLQSLIKEGFNKIVIVNDGSDNIDSILDMEKLNSCKLINLKTNGGKGQALKQGINYILDNYSEAKYILTCDDDMQHLPEDIKKIAKYSLEANPEIAVGSRKFNFKNTPLKSYLGNLIMRNLLNIFFGFKIRDTQTGLRCISKSLAKELLNVRGVRFEFELNSLIYILKKGYNVKELDINTIYYDSNNRTRFHGIKDSYRVVSSFVEKMIRG